MPYWETSAKVLLEKEGIEAEENLCDKFLSMSLPESANYLINTYNLKYTNQEVCQKIDDIMEEGLSRSFTGWGRKPLVPSTCAGDLRKV